MTKLIHNIYGGVMKMTINAKLKKLREANGFNQKNIADFLEVDQSLISKIEKGERTLTSSMINGLSNLFGVPTSYFFEDVDNNNRTVCAFRASDLSQSDMKTISLINRIALNANFMSELLREE